MLSRKLFLVGLIALVAAGCATTMREAARPVGPFELAILATSDTRGEIEPCG